MDMREYVAAFDQVRIDFERDVAEFGLPFEQGESSPRKLRDEVAARTGCHCENCSASLWRKWISPACVACRTGERTETFFVSLACNRDCYFCFNPNQVDYEYHRTHRRDIASELESQHAAGAHFDFLAVTGGEPLLFKDEVLAFLEKARELYPMPTRAYTPTATCSTRSPPDSSRRRGCTRYGSASSRKTSRRLWAISPRAVNPRIPAVRRADSEAPSAPSRWRWTSSPTSWWRCR